MAAYPDIVAIKTCVGLANVTAAAKRERPAIAGRSEWELIGDGGVRCSSRGDGAFLLFSSFRVVFQRRAGADEVAVAIDIVDPVDR